jgi:hypothetical protein
MIVCQYNELNTQQSISLFKRGQEKEKKKAVLWTKNKTALSASLFSIYAHYFHEVIARHLSY